MSEFPPEPLALTGGRIVLPDRLETHQALVVDQGRIAALVDVDAVGPQLAVVDVGGRLIAPGLIDIHTHGALGYTFNDPDAAAFAAITQAQAQHGVTALLAYRCIGPDRLSIVSDATSGAGLEDGPFFRMGSMEYVVQDGVGMMLDHTAFGGSTTFLNQMIPVLTEAVGVPLVEAIRMASLTPARAIGVDARKGSLSPGKDADVVIFEDDFTPWRVMVGGRWVQRA